MASASVVIIKAVIDITITYKTVYNRYALNLNPYYYYSFISIKEKGITSTS